MSRIDEYEYRRGPVRRYPSRNKHAKRPDPREAQLTMKLFGGTTAKDRGEPFNDSIDFIGRQ